MWSENMLDSDTSAQANEDEQTNAKLASSSRWINSFTITLQYYEKINGSASARQ
jgi:hypothetical protein